MGNKIGAYITLDGEREFKSAVQSCNKSLSTLKSEMNLVETQSKGQANSIEQYTIFSGSFNNIGLELVDGFNDLQKYFDQVLNDRTLGEFERQAGILGKTIKNNAQTAHAIVNASFANAKFSDRIWMYQDMLKVELSKLLQEGLIQGRNPRQLARHLEKLFGVSKANAERLMRTELARVQTEAQKQSFEQNGFKQYEFIALGSACDICKELAGKHFDVEKMMPGENAPPMHPNCRCSVAAYEDSEDYEAWLDFLDKGGTTAEWNKLKEEKSKPSQKSGDKVLEKSDKESKITAAGNLNNYDRKSKIYTINEDIKMVNPSHNKGAEYQQNCQRCVPAYELRR